MKKIILLAILLLFVAVNVTAMTYGGGDLVQKSIGFDKTE
jgi:hypothetical protein